EPSVNNAGDLLELDSAAATMSGGSTWTTGSLNIGAFGTGVVNVTGGSRITVQTALALGAHRSATTLRYGTGELTISRAGSEVVVNGGTNLGTGDAILGGVGIVTVDNGGKLITNATVLGGS